VRRLLLDQGVPRSTGALLIPAGWDVIHLGDIGLSRATDPQILIFARTEQRVCVTLDADFHALLATSGERSPSVVRVRRQGLDGSAFAALLQLVWPRIESDVDAGAMVTITERAVRIRRLPIEKP
jgi:predicted nuclease of predicted toxin-antitoxin system